MDLPGYSISLCSSDPVCEIKLWILQLILRKMFGLTLEFRREHESKRSLFEIYSLKGVRGKDLGG
jgi:hypothetical protein